MIKKNIGSLVIVILTVFLIGIMYKIQIESVKDSGRTITYIEETDVYQSKTIELKMVVIGEKYTDTQIVLDELNIMLKAAAGITLSVTYLDPNELDLAYHNLFAGGADFDLIQIKPYTYNEYVAKRAYMGITEDMINSKMPQTISDMSPMLIEDCKINNRLYMIPSESYLTEQKVMIVRGDLLAKTNMTKIKSIEDLESYFEIVLEKAPELIPIAIGDNGFSALELFYLQNTSYELYDPYLNVYDQMSGDYKWLIDDAGFEAYLDMLIRWQKSKFFNTDGYVSNTPSKTLFMNGNIASLITTIYEAENIVRELHMKNPSYAPQIINFDQKAFNNQQAIPAGFAIKNGSVNAAKSLEFIELLRNDSTIFKLLNYGIEGVHYAINGNNEYIPLKSSVDYPIYNTPIWYVLDKNALGYQFRLPEFSLKQSYEYQPPKTVHDFNPTDHERYKKTTQTLLYPMLNGESESQYTVEAYRKEMQELGFDAYLNQLTKNY